MVQTAHHPGGAHRPYGDIVYQSLKTATAQAVRQVGGQEAAATVSRIGAHSSFARYGGRQWPEYCPIDVALDLDASAGKPMILGAMAHALGFVVIPVPRGGDQSAMLREFSELAQATGEALARLGEALADDGEIDAEEIERLELVAVQRDLLTVASRIEEALKSTLEADHGNRRKHKAK